MKRILLTVFCSLLLIACMAGCGKSEKDTPKENFQGEWRPDMMNDGSKIGQITAIDDHTLTISTMAGFGGGMNFEDFPDNGEMPKRPDGGEMPEMPQRPDGGEMPEMPNGGEMPEMPNGGEMPESETLTITVTDNTAITVSGKTNGSISDLSKDDFIRFTVDENNNALTIETMDDKQL